MGIQKMWKGYHTRARLFEYLECEERYRRLAHYDHYAIRIQKMYHNLI
jgi:hypothetical protein